MVKFGCKHSPETRAKISEKMCGRKLSEETRKKMSLSHTGKSLSDHHTACIQEALNKPEVRQKISDGVKKNSPNRGKHVSDVTKAKISATERGKIISPEATEKRRISMTNPDGSWKMSGENHPLWGKHPTPETRKKLSDSHKGEKAYQWKGGNYVKSYCFKFRSVALKEYIRDKFDRCCFICGTKENGKCLAIHHIDYNKLQGCKGLAWSLVPLCSSCHSKTNHTRWYWFSLLINYWALNSEINISEDFNDNKFGGFVPGGGKLASE